MPIYEFECRACGNRFEKLCGIRGFLEGLTCPDCGSSDVGKMISSFAAMHKDADGETSTSSCSGCTRSSCASCR